MRLPGIVHVEVHHITGQSRSVVRSSVSRQELVFAERKFKPNRNLDALPWVQIELLRQEETEPSPSDAVLVNALPFTLHEVCQGLWCIEDTLHLVMTGWEGPSAGFNTKHARSRFFISSVGARALVSTIRLLLLSFRSSMINSSGPCAEKLGSNAG